MLRRILRRAIAALDGSAGMLVLWRAGGAAPLQEETVGLRPEAARDLARRLASVRPGLERLAAQPQPPAGPLQTQVTADVGLLRHHLALLPLWADERTFGLIGVLRVAAAFSPAEERVLAAFADQAGISVRNTELVALLRREKASLNRVIEQSTDGVVVCDRERRIVSVNAALERMSGLPRRELVGQRLEEALVFRPERDSAGRIGLLSFDLQETGREIEAVLQAADGALVHVTLSAAVPDGGRAPDEQIILYVRNVTRLHELEELRSTFLGMTSHELQTPVAIIKAYAETLQRKFGDGDPVLRDALQAIDGETDRLARLITNLLRVARAEAGWLPVRLVDVDLADLAAQVVERLRARTTKHQFVVRFPDAFPVVAADPERIEEVLSNLVDNAIKYSPDGGTITVEGRVTPSMVEVRVADEGPGIPLGEQARLFQRFYRLQGDPNRKTTGVGLGLYLVRAVVEAHGGRVWVESEWGQGATFGFALPRRTGPALPIGAPGSETELVGAP